MSEELELMKPETGELIPVAGWRGAAVRGLDARKEREAIVEQILKQGLDFGSIPGCGDKPALLKPGAEKIADALGLYPDYEELDKIQDFTAKIWFYRYRCRLRQRGTDAVMSTGIGSCNSETAKYKYRDAQRLCPGCGKAAIIKGREEYGGGWLCFTKKGGCGAKFNDIDERIVGQQTGQIENPDIASLVNTVDKMAQKSAFVAACLNLGFSEQFTQDIDDNPSAFRAPEPPAHSNAPTTRSQVASQREAFLKAVQSACKLLNNEGYEPPMTPRALDAYVNREFQVTEGVKSLQSAEDIEDLLKRLSEKLDTFRLNKIDGETAAF